MAKRNQTRSAVSYVKRAVEDEYVRDQLRNGASRLRSAYARAAENRGRRRPASKDKKVYRSMREAASTLTKAVGAVQQPPPKESHRGRTRIVLALACVSALVLLRRRSRPQQDFEEAAAAPLRSASSPSANNRVSTGAAVDGMVT